MNATQIRNRLHLRIEQADEQVLTVLSEMTESLFKMYQPQAEAPNPNQQFHPMTRRELTSEIEASMAEYERGNCISLEESSQEAASWLLQY